MSSGPDAGLNRARLNRARSTRIESVRARAQCGLRPRIHGSAGRLCRDSAPWQQGAAGCGPGRRPRLLNARGLLGGATARGVRKELRASASGTVDSGWDRRMACMDNTIGELHNDGWLVNQTRMWLASHWAVRQGLDWRDGEEHFFRHLLDKNLPESLQAKPIQ